jgi:pimeloyl-ACP methyl ester carboxylesterase
MNTDIAHGWRGRSIAAGLIAVALGALALKPDLAGASTRRHSAPADFEHHSVRANGVHLHYVTMGEGEPVLLVPGWPQSWYAWRFVMKDLAATGRKVYAIDPRGFGDSDKPAVGYDLVTASQDMHAFIEAAGIARPGGIDVVSHDVGTWIAYAHANAYPQDVRRLVLSEALIPGTTPPAGPPNDEGNVKSWHFGFNRLNDLPEMLVQGHERSYLSWLFSNKSLRSWRIDDATLDEYVRVFSTPGAARAGFEYYRQAFNEDGIAQGKVRTARKLQMPVFTLAGSGGLGANMLKNVQPLAENVSGAIIEGCGHYLPEECDIEYVRAVQAFWNTAPVGNP